MFKELSFKDKFRCFDPGDTLIFREGINLLVGENGAGKSTILDIITGKIKGQIKDIVTIKSSKIEYIAFDFEKDNPRIKGRIDSVQNIISHFLSQGQTNKGILKRITNVKDTLIIMDQPETGLSIKAVRELIESLILAKMNGCQIIMSTHHPYIISSVGDVLSLDIKKWTTSEIYLQ